MGHPIWNLTPLIHELYLSFLSFPFKSDEVRSSQLDILETLHKELHKKANVVIERKSDNVHNFNNDIEEVKKIHREMINILEGM